MPVSNIQALISDWAGTTVDFGCQAPVLVFVEVFRAAGVEITRAEARGPMGLAKRDHICAILEIPRVTRLWQEQYGRPATDGDVNRLYAQLEPRLAAVVEGHHNLIPGTLELTEYCRSHGIKFGSTTGYVRSMMRPIIPLAAAAGFQPDCIVTSDEVPAGRPAPFMIYENMRRLQLYPAWQMVKLGDTVADVQEGRNAGLWTVAFTLSGNESGLTEAELAALDAREADLIRRRAITRLSAAGADYICDGIWDCLPLLEQIHQRIGRGERPGLNSPILGELNGE